MMEPVWLRQLHFQTTQKPNGPLTSKEEVIKPTTRLNTLHSNHNLEDGRGSLLALTSSHHAC